ncbi:TetR/AcrR family transcriptional regulator [Pseudogracilibacillus auburnensis]|uniref:TetR family transcriptional regulator n=1 Tax=Pseudogracilibacillus auburnensis TaxID=1494959 RepID=A0A2V3VUJ9_9BACI|nr:TetR/AcrR family transcriptional regulator [Pseudogracilibacillus auburnensis]MBO1004108.1 TetR/AcrR family transcriptional regulator [Pseudogracilibacillus auburnensis]PXW85602.1 TetR family transcriptional regulator [Pseudogracilibacillus auburnensis]
MAIDRRQEVLNAATKSFSLYGYKATTMDQVARLANVGKGTIYTFFKNKEELFDEIITKLIDDMEKAATNAINSEMSFQENVHLALYKMLEFRLEHQLTIKLFQEERDIGTPVVQQVMQKLEQSILFFIREKIERAIEKGEIKQCDPEITAFILLKLYVAFIFDWEKNRKPLNKEEIAHLFDLYIFKGLSNR